MSWWQVFLYLGPLVSAIVRLKALVGGGTVRTKIVAELPDGTQYEVPFVTITL